MLLSFLSLLRALPSFFPAHASKSAQLKGLSLFKQGLLLPGHEMVMVFSLIFFLVFIKPPPPPPPKKPLFRLGLSS